MYPPWRLISALGISSEGRRQYPWLCLAPPGFEPAYRGHSVDWEGAGEPLAHFLAHLLVGVQNHHVWDRSVPPPLCQQIDASIGRAASFKELLSQAVVLHGGPLIGADVEAEGPTSDGVKGPVQGCHTEVIPEGKRSRTGWDVEHCSLELIGPTDGAPLPHKDLPPGPELPAAEELSPIGVLHIWAAHWGGLSNSSFIYLNLARVWNLSPKWHI